MLRLQGVSKSFDGRAALCSLSFEVRPGDVYGLVGPNGAGKSTAFGIICNLLVPDSGSVTIGGEGAALAPRNALGVVAQQIALYKNLSCNDNLRFFGSLYGLRGTELALRIGSCLADVGLTDRAESLVRTLSGGMQRRLHVGVALLHRPKLVILDEPSAGLDVESRQAMWALVRRMQSEGKATLLTTHLLEEAESLCSRIGILQQGRLIAEGSPDELKARVEAEDIAIIQSRCEQDVVEAAERQGLTVRAYEDGLAVWLRRHMELREVLDLFSGVPIDAISRRAVRLEDVYWELTRPRLPSRRNLPTRPTPATV